MPDVFKIFSVFLVAMVKYFYTPIFAYFAGLGFWESVIPMVIGGSLSFSFFYYISRFIVISTKYVKPAIRNITPGSWLDKYDQRRELKKLNKKKFTRRNKMLVRLRRMGMWAIIFSTPVLLSLPVGAFLLRKYYHLRKGVVLFAILIIILEGFLMCLLIWKVPSVRP